MTCRYPNYGYDCQRGCMCEEDSCNHVTGCLQTSNVLWGFNKWLICSFVYTAADLPINTSTKRAKYNIFVEIIIIYIKSGHASVLSVGTSQNAFNM